MKRIIIICASTLFAAMLHAQNVGIGTATPVAKLDIRGISSNPSIPGPTSTGVLRIGVSSNDGIDIGKMSLPPYSGWIQSGFNGTTADPLVLQPESGAVGIGTTNPLQTLDVNGAIKIGTTSTNQPGAIRFNAGKFEGGDGTSWKSFEGTTSGIVGTKLYNNPALLNAGYSLFGEIPGISSYSTVNTTFSANTWQPTYTRGIVTNVSAPPENLQGTAPALTVWTGSLMYVATISNLYAYNPVTDIWSIASNQGVSFGNAKAVWTGSEIIIWGSGLGSRYNPATNTWTSLPLTNAPSSRGLYTMIWDGSRVIIWGGTSGGINLNTGAMYNPATNLWTAMATLDAPSARILHTAVWNNAAGRMIIWGGSITTFSGETNTGGIFDPVTNTWTGTTNTAGAPSVRNNHTAIWTDTEMIIFGGLFNTATLNTGGKYNPLLDTWIASSSSGAPSVYLHSAIWTGVKMFVTGGRGVNQISQSSSYSYDPTSNLWTTNDSFSSQEGKESHPSFHAGNMILIWGGKNKTTESAFVLPFNSNTGYRYFLVNFTSSATTLTNETLYLYQKN